MQVVSKAYLRESPDGNEVRDVLAVVRRQESQHCGDGGGDGSSAHNHLEDAL
jgi:hypothetical protein